MPPSTGKKQKTNVKTSRKNEENEQDTIKNTRQKEGDSPTNASGRLSKRKQQQESKSKSICACPENDGLYKFLEKMRQSEKRRAPNSQFHFTINKAARSVKNSKTIITFFGACFFFVKQF